MREQTYRLIATGGVIIAVVGILVLVLMALICTYANDELDRTHCREQGGRIIEVHNTRGDGWFCDLPRNQVEAP